MPLYFMLFINISVIDAILPFMTERLQYILAELFSMCLK